jgi:hypothetical protein
VIKTRKEELINDLHELLCLCGERALYRGTCMVPR